MRGGQAAVDAGDIDAVFILPENLSTAVMIGRAEIDVLGNVDAPIAQAVAIAMAEEFSRRVRTASLAAQTALVAGVIGPAEIAAATSEAAQLTRPLAMETIEFRSRQVDTTTFFIAGLGIFFTFFIVGTSVTSMLEERMTGTLGRLLVAPIRPASIVGGKTLASIILGVTAMFILAIASTFDHGRRLGEPLGGCRYHRGYGVCRRRFDDVRGRTRPERRTGRQSSIDRGADNGDARRHLRANHHR